MARARLLNVLNMAAVELGVYDEAMTAGEQALELSMTLGNTDAQATLLGNLAEIQLRAGNLGAAAEHQLECLNLALELGASQHVGSALIVAARPAATSDDWATATQLQSRASALLDEIGLSLYPSDQALCAELLASAAEQLRAARAGPT